MKCPVCEEQTLETLSTAIGTFERCPRCSGLFIHQDLITAVSHDKAKCEAALQETKGLLLPTERSCPKCLQKFFDGRVRSRDVILTLCPTCQSFWTTLPILNQFDETVERALRLEMEIVANAEAAKSVSRTGGGMASTTVSFTDDKGLGRFFRAFARLFDRWADNFGREPGEKESKPDKQAKPPKRIQSVEPVPPVQKVKSVKPVEPEAPKIEIPQFIFPEESITEEKPEPKLEPKPKVEPKPEPAPEPKPEPKPEPQPEPKPEPQPEPKPEPKPEPPATETGGRAPEVWRSKPEPKPEPVAAKPVPKAIDVPQPKPQPSAIGKFFSVFKPKPRPRPAPKPVTPVKPVQPVKPVTPIKPVEPAKPVLPPKPKGEGFMKKLFGSFKPKPRPAKSVKPVASAQPVKPVEPVKPAEPVKPIEQAKPVEPAKLVEPTKPIKPAQPVKPTPAPKAPKPKKEKVPRDPIDHLAVWPPWAMAFLGVVCSAFRDFGFEAGPAVLWGIAGWAMGTMIRLVRLYRSPVSLAGQIVLADEQDPKGKVVLKMEDKTILLNPIGRWDILPRLFGLSNPRQLLKGDVTLKGWYRGKLIPSFEIDEIRAEKVVRKSMVKTLRWVSAILVLVVAVAIYVSLE